MPLGFFVTGTNPFGANYNNTNVATLPDNTTIVSIDNVSPFTNPAFYINNVACTNIALDGINYCFSQGNRRYSL